MEKQAMIRHLLLCAGLHGSREALAWLRETACQRRADAVLFAGGILPIGRPAAGHRTPWSLTLEEVRFGEEFFATLGQLRSFCAVIPGTAGEPLEEFLRIGLRAEMLFPTVHIAHATLVEEDGLAVTGLGGVLAEKELLGVDTWSRPTAEYFLRSLWKVEHPHKALLLPTPPPGKLGGPEGDPLIGDLIDSLHPNLCVAGGSTIRRGCMRVGHTLVVNPGRLADGSAAWMDWSRRGQEQIEFLNRKFESPNMSRRAPPSREAIQRRAYQRWQVAGKPEGDPLRFWLEAEREMTCGR
jgi:hypothetical protein